VLELWALAEQAEPGRQRRYLREILELDPNNVKAANMLGTDVGMRADELDGAPPGVSLPKGTTALADAPESGSNPEMLDVEELEELSDDEFDVADPSAKISLAIGSAAGAHDELPSGERFREQPYSSGRDDGHGDDADDDLIPLVVEPVADSPLEDALPAPVEDRFGFSDEDSGPIGDSSERSTEQSVEDVEPDAAGSEPRRAAMAPTDSERHAVSAGIEALGRSRDRDRDRAPAPPAKDDDHDIRTRFDEAPLKFLGQETLFGGGNEEIDESELPPVENLRLPGTATVPKAAVLRDDDDEGRTENAPPEGATNLEDDLDEADFFVQQSLFQEARDILQSLLERHPSHPLVSAKLRDLEAMERTADGHSPLPPVEEPTPLTPPPPIESIVSSDSGEHSTNLAAEPPDELPGSSDAEAPPSPDAGDPVYEVTRRGVIEKGVTAEDFETHYDLGIAYKEMGLLDDAIAEFKLVMKDAAREVQCHLMIGLCCLEKGLQTEAIGHFKKGLYVEGITERESLSLYFELGQAYERLGDPREALYYYEKVIKRDPRFRNVEKLVESLRGGATASTNNPAAPGGEDVDAAFDTLLDGNGS
ncbi:MAG TPA: tetratricopeptide repeat protein, partial [Polyangia bacterium]|nr:tetratricopeptide repeat protein [Polyangia bacterium]